MESLQRRPSGIYVARLIVPQGLRRAVGKTEFIATTGTSQLPIAKIVAGALLTQWRQKILDLSQLAGNRTLMNDDRILRIAEAHPLLTSDTHLPLDQAADLLGLEVKHLLTMASNGHLCLFSKLTRVPGYLVRRDALEVDDPELGTILIPAAQHMPVGAQRHVANGFFLIPVDDVSSVAQQLMNDAIKVVAYRFSETDDALLFLPDDTVKVSIGTAEVRTSQLDHLRRTLAEKIDPEHLSAVKEIRLRRAHSATAPSAGDGKRVSHAVGEFMKERRKGGSSENARRVQAACDLFVELMGDPPVSEVTRGTLRRYKDRVLPTVPARENQLRAKHGTKTMTESVAAARKQNWPALSQPEQAKRLQWFGECVAWMAHEGWIVGEPMANLVAAAPRKQHRDQDGRDAFSEADLNKVFSASWFVNGKGQMTKERTYREYAPHYYWLPLLGLFTGARINELCQLYLRDIRQASGDVWFIDINASKPDKRLKNANSRRLIPLHPELVKLGLPDWCMKLQEEGHDRLFPELRFDEAKGYSKDAVKWFGRFKTALRYPSDGKLVFHSFRHTFITACLNRLRLDDLTVAQLSGHARGSSVLSETYRKDQPPDDLIGAISKLSYSLPAIAPFDIDAGLKALKDAMRRKASGRSA